MVRPICKDVFTLALKSKDATKEDIETARDLLDTLAAHRGECVGMAANMIGVSKRIIAVGIGPMNIAMLNPVFRSLRSRGRMPVIKRNQENDTIPVDYC